jgi:hypothetical protein
MSTMIYFIEAELSVGGCRAGTSVSGCCLRKWVINPLMENIIK